MEERKPDADPFWILKHSERTEYTERTEQTVCRTRVGATGDGLGLPGHGCPPVNEANGYRLHIQVIQIQRHCYGCINPELRWSGCVLPRLIAVLIQGAPAVQAQLFQIPDGNGVVATVYRRMLPRPR